MLRLRRNRLVVLLCLFGCGMFFLTNRKPTFVVQTNHAEDLDYKPSLKKTNTTIENHFSDLSFISARNNSTAKNEIPEISGTFCEFIDLGCFPPTNFGKSGPLERHENMTQNQCALHCHKRKRSYAGLMKGGICSCDLDVRKIGNIRSESHECNIACPGKLDENCGGEKGVRALRIKSGCFEAPFNDSLVEKRTIGCFSAPTSGDGFLLYQTISSTRCFEKCQVLGHSLALFREAQDCFCGRMNARFNLTHKLKQCEGGNSVQGYRTLEEDKRCGNIRILPQGSYVRTWLGSAPGSGITWTRYLLEKATGYYGGSAYGELIMHLNGFLGEMFPISEGRTDFVKNHLMDPKKPDLQDVILVIRNPYNAFIADFHRVSTKGNHTGRASRQQFDNEFLKYIQSTIVYWKTMPENLLKSKKPFLIIFYEHMVEDPVSNVRKMVNFLPNKHLHPKDLDERLACLSQELKGSFKRKSAKLDFNPYTEHTTTEMNKAIAYARKTLLDAGVSPVMPDYETAGPDVNLSDGKS